MSIKTAFQPARSPELPDGVSIQPRRFEFEDLESVPQYWFANNPLLTHFENAFSIFIPPGERFFIRSVRRYQDRATDPESQKNTRSSREGEMATSFSARRTAGSWVSPPNITWAIRPSCSSTAATSLGCP